MNYAEEEIPVETLTINIGERQSETNVRYAQFNGYRTKIAEDGTDTFVLNLSSNSIVGIIEKANEDTPEIVSSAYYYVNAEEKTYSKLGLDSYMTTDGKKSVRVKDPMGIRFKYAALKAAKLENDAFVIDEIGFIVAVTDRLGDTELTLNYDKYVTGVAYNKAENKDIVFDSSDDIDVFTCVVTNIPISQYKTNLTCKTYTKMTIDGEQFVIYGEPTIGNIYDTAKKLLETDPDNADLIKIVLDADYSIGIDGGVLYD